VGLTRITAPAEQPLTRLEVKDFLRLDHDLDDAMLDALIASATAAAEAFTRRALITQTWDWTLDALPAVLEVPLPPLQSVGSITYIDSAGASQTLASTEYTVDAASQRGRIVPAFGKTWPATQGVVNAVTVRFTAGYGDRTAVPQPIRLAMLQHVAHWYEHRESVVVGAVVSEMAAAGARLLGPYRSLTL